MYKLNPFVHIFRRGNIVAIFNSITLTTVYFPKKNYERIFQSPTKDLIEDAFFVEGDFNALKYLMEYVNKINVEHNLGIAYFLVVLSIR